MIKAFTSNSIYSFVLAVTLIAGVTWIIRLVLTAMGAE